MTATEKAERITWNIEHHLKRLHKKALEPNGLTSAVLQVNGNSLHGYYNQLMVLKMNESMRIEDSANKRAFNRLFNAIALVALAS